MEPPKQAITYLSIADMIAEIKYRHINGGILMMVFKC
jgi:hypothetical protein